MTATKELILAKFKHLEEELKFLRYFYETASDYMGPADGDIYDEIKVWYLNNRAKLPKGYEFEDEE